MVTDLTIPSDISVIKNYAFVCVDGLKTVIVHDGVTDIGIDTFWNCDSLNTITLGTGVKSIGYRLVAANTNSVNVYCKAIVPPSCKNKDSIFSNTDYELTIYVPNGSLSAYKASAAWKSGGSIIGYNF